MNTEQSNYQANYSRLKETNQNTIGINEMQLSRKMYTYICCLLEECISFFRFFLTLSMFTHSTSKNIEFAEFLSTYLFDGLSLCSHKMHLTLFPSRIYPLSITKVTILAKKHILSIALQFVKLKTSLYDLNGF